MPTKQLIFEQPLNERIRTCLRVETLMRRYHYFESLKGDWAAYNALLTVLEITALLERGDLKQELMKELERQHSALQALISHQEIDASKLELVLSKQEQGLDRLHKLDGKLGEHLKRNDFLLSIKQRTSIPGGSCDFDLPQLRFWLNQDHHYRLNDLQAWIAPYKELELVIELVLKSIRESAQPKTSIAENGFFQQSLDTQQPNQMIRVSVESKLSLYPEISAGKHRFSIRFMEPAATGVLPTQARGDVSFLLSRCAL